MKWTSTSVAPSTTTSIRITSYNVCYTKLLRIPVIVDEVTTLCGPGELIDVIVTERGIAINPLRQDLIDRTKNSGLPLRTIESLKDEIESICGGAPEKPRFRDNPIAAIKWVDGTVIDIVRQLQ